MASRSAQSSALEGKKRKRDTEDGTVAVKPFKSKVLILSSRGITYHMRHLMNDVGDLVTHGKKGSSLFSHLWSTDAKLDTKHSLPLINELAELSSCNHALYFEARRRTDLYLWAARCPNGPSIRFHVVNANTMGEVKMTGNCLKGSRPIVTFGQEFDDSPSWKVCKEVLSNIFAVPKTARKAKPFVDHVISFSILDGKIWFRNYQIIDKPSGSAEEEPKHKKRDQSLPGLSLAEIGPRFVLVPIKIFEGSFGGPCLWENKEFVPPLAALKEQKKEAALKYGKRKEQERERIVRKVGRDEKEREGLVEELEKRMVFA